MSASPIAEFLGVFGIASLGRPIGYDDLMPMSPISTIRFSGRTRFPTPSRGRSVPLAGARTIGRRNARRKPIADAKAKPGLFLSGVGLRLAAELPLKPVRL